MVIKEGYKQTEIGVIPMDWEVKSIKGITIDMLQGVNTAIDIPEYVESGYPMLKANNIIDREVNFSTSDHISVKTYQGYNDRFKIKKDDFLFSNIGARLGTGSLMKTNTECSFAWNVMRIIPNIKLVKPAFLSCIMNSPALFIEIKKNESGSGMGFVPKNVLQNLTFPLPPSLAEQTAIATALSDADGLITGLEKLIAKKRNIKQGAMQQLLQPKEDWEVKKLGEVCDLTGAGIDKKINPNEISVTLLNYLDVYRRDYIYRNELNHKVTAPYNKMLSCDVKKGDIFLTPSSELRTDIGISAISMEDMDGVVYSYHIYRLRFNTNIDKLFGLFLLKTNSFLMQAETFCEGSGKRYVISMGKFKEMTVSFPNSLIEQTRIATILSDMDKELSALEQKLEKYKKVKLGMMQELLTGKTRLV